MRWLVGIVPRRVRLVWLGPVATVMLAAAAMAVAPGVAAAQLSCDEANPSYTDACGPTFVVPGWGDAGGWTDPSKYSTIRLADVNGDSKDELIARNDQGVEIFWFDTSVGQWRPQVDGNATQQVLTDFRSPLPTETPATDWSKPEYYSTIQTANLDGRPGDEVYARFADGVRAYTYVPPERTTNIDGGSWQRIGGSAGFGDAVGGADPSIYTTIRAGALYPDEPAYIFGRRHPTSDDPGPLALAVLENGNWRVSSAVNPSPLEVPPAWTDRYCAQPSCYLSLQAAAIATSVRDTSTGYRTNLQRPGELLTRTRGGVGAWTTSSLGEWFLIGGNHPFTGVGPGWMEDDSDLGPFADVPGPDCPFSSNGASGAGSGDCLGASPLYYETLGTANLDGKPGQELLARASDGLRAKRFNGTAYDSQAYDSLATLTDLAGAGLIEYVEPALWASIRTGDIDGDGKDEVLAIGDTGLEAWSYQPGSNTWAKLPGSVGLTGDWRTNYEYFSTLRVGDVDGDGRDDVVARGRFGIRTWFYDRSGSGGWERYLAGGYPAFATAGRQAAFVELNDVALRNGAITSGTIRQQWTGEGQADATTLSALQDKLAGSLVGNCSVELNLAPPRYATCAPPAGYTEEDWTAVVNEMLAEAYWAEQVVEHFGDLKTIREGVFESETGALPAIGTNLEIAGAAGNTASFDLGNFFSGTTGLAASLAALADADPEAEAALWTASEVFSMLPSASDTATSTFQTTYAGLLDRFAAVQDDMADAWASQQQQVLGDLGLLGLVGQLRARKTWALDIQGMISASRQSFALETYQALLPTMYQRYVVTNCTDQAYPNETLNCELPTGSSVIGRGKNAATWLGPTLSSDPCPGKTGNIEDCNYAQNPGTVPDSVANIVWGRLAPPDSCYDVPGNDGTSWHYGCPLGVPTATSIGADSPGWSFTTQTGNPIVAYLFAGRSAVSARSRVARATGAGYHSVARAAQAGTKARGARDRLGPLLFSGRVGLSRALRPRRMRVVVGRTLFEHGRREELARSRAGRRLRPFALRHVRGGLFASRRRGGPRVRLEVRRLADRPRARVDLRLNRVRTRDIRALCTVVPARISRAGRPLELETRLRLRDRGAIGRITLRQRWRCVRDRKGEFTGIRHIKPRRPAARPGLAVRMRAPLVLASGRRATVRVTVANQRRRRPSRVVSSLWNLRITGTAGGPGRTVRIRQLRAGRSRAVRLTLPVVRTPRGRVCVRVAVNAASARGATARRCAGIAAASRLERAQPSVTLRAHPRRTAAAARSTPQVK